MENHENYIEPYAKEKNLIQLSLFYFGKGRPEKTAIQWIDNDRECKLECVCKYGVPGSFEQDCHTAIMRLWIKQGKPKGVKLNYSDIARELHLNPRNWVSHIKQSLKRLAQARYEFTRCFIVADQKTGTKEENIHFSLFDSASFFEYEQGKSKRNSESCIIFSENIQKNLEANYYQLLDMAWYRSLPDGLPRRLYEYLAKRKYHSVKGKFIISEEVICRWLPIKDKNTTTRRRRLNKISNKLIEAGYLLEYEFNAKKKQCLFTYAEDSTKKVEKEKQDFSNDIASPEKTIYCEALKWIDNIPYFHAKRKDEIELLEMGKIVSCYSGIKAEYDRKKKEGKAPNAGWVYRAFTEEWKFSDQKEMENRKKELIEKIDRIKKQKDMVLEFIDKQGGASNLLYKEQVFDVMVDYGLCLVNVNVLEHWDEVSLDLFRIMGE